MKILIADDDPQILRALRITLTARGYEVVTAHDGKAALDAATSVHPDIVVLDLGCQGIHISNQSEIYKLAPSARGRVYAAYMTCYFIGGTLGSIGSALCYAGGGWAATAALGTAFGALVFLLALTERRYQRRDASLRAVSPQRPPA